MTIKENQVHAGDRVQANRRFHGNQLWIPKGALGVVKSSQPPGHKFIFLPGYGATLIHEDFADSIDRVRG